MSKYQARLFTFICLDKNELKYVLSLNIVSMKNRRNIHTHTHYICVHTYLFYRKISLFGFKFFFLYIILILILIYIFNIFNLHITM